FRWFQEYEIDEERAFPRHGSALCHGHAQFEKKLGK
ncbi:hypothetical protein Q604_UNBC17028G0001, partial [human gut metagenome]